MTKRKPDLLVHGGGSLYMLRPVSRRGSRWIADNIADDATRFGGAVAVEHRFILDVVRGAVSDGLRVR